MYSFRELTDIIENEIKHLKYPKGPHLLYEPIAYSLEEGGKRIRPVSLLMACNLFSERIEQAKPAALAIEVFHNFTLLHDDIMDRSDLRRGKPAVHTRWNDNVAILSGDAMMIYAYRLLCSCETQIQPQLLDIFNETADDLFDTYGDASVFGKPIGGDILAGKKTYLLTSALKAADEPTRNEILALIHDKQIDAATKIDSVRSIYDRLGIRQSTEKAISEYFREAELILHHLNLPEERIVPLHELAEKLLKRKK